VFMVLLCLGHYCVYGTAGFPVVRTALFHDSTLHAVSMRRLSVYELKLLMISDKEE
jgi:hypothetical protein